MPSREKESQAEEWEYTVQLFGWSARRYLGDDEDKVRNGMSWSLCRSKGNFTQSIVVSPEVFENEEDAKADAVQKLAILLCPIEQPVAKALRWHLE